MYGGIPSTVKSVEEPLGPCPPMPRNIGDAAVAISSSRRTVNGAVGARLQVEFCICTELGVAVACNPS